MGRDATMTDQQHENAGESPDTEAGLKLLARAVEFLSTCRTDPERAVENDDPALLVEGLRDLLSSLEKRSQRASDQESPRDASPDPSTDGDRQEPPLAA